MLDWIMMLFNAGLFAFIATILLTTPSDWITRLKGFAVMFISSYFAWMHAGEVLSQ